MGPGPIHALSIPNPQVAGSSRGGDVSRVLARQVQTVPSQQTPYSDAEKGQPHEAGQVAAWWGDEWHPYRPSCGDAVLAAIIITQISFAVGWYRYFAPPHGRVEMHWALDNQPESPSHGPDV